MFTQQKKATFTTFLVILIIFVTVLLAQSIPKENQKSSRPVSKSELREEVLKAAKVIMQNEQFRKALIMDHVEPVSHPEQLKRSFHLSDVELHALLTFAARYQMYQNRKMMEKHGNIILGWNVKLSEDFWQSGRNLDENGRKSAQDMVSKIEKTLHLDLELRK